MITIWNSLVRPNLYYCSPLWAPSPSNYGEIDMLEDTQRSFTRNVNGMEGLDYAQRLKKLKMYSIQRRHERYKILYVYKIKEKLVPNVTQSHGLYFEYGRHGCECKLPRYLIRKGIKKARENSFALTARNLWNSLPRGIRDISGEDLKNFKRKLDRVLSYPDIPRCSHCGHAYTGEGNRSNSLHDHYLNPGIRSEMENCLKPR